jgi:hypothetical protein
MRAACLFEPKLRRTPLAALNQGLTSTRDACTGFVSERGLAFLSPAGFKHPSGSDVRVTVALKAPKPAWVCEPT